MATSNGDPGGHQELWLAGERVKAANRAPVELGFKTNLLGTPAMVKDRIRLYRDAGVTTLQAKLEGTAEHRLDTLAQLIDLVDDVSRES